MAARTRIRNSSTIPIASAYVVVGVVVDLLDDRARERLVVVLDVAADDDDRRDLGERRADRGDHGHEDADLRLAQCQQRELASPGAEHPGLLEQAGGEALDRRGDERDDVRQGQDRLRDVDAAERERDVQRAERALREQQDQDEDADEHRRQGEARVREDVQCASARGTAPVRSRARSGGR